MRSRCANRKRESLLWYNTFFKDFCFPEFLPWTLHYVINIALSPSLDFAMENQSNSQVSRKIYHIKTFYFQKDFHIEFKYHFVILSLRTGDISMFQGLAMFPCSGRQIIKVKPYTCKQGIKKYALLHFINILLQ